MSQYLCAAVHVDVDFLGPFALTVKKSARDFYVRLPPPLQQGLPYVAVGATTSIIVWKIQGSRLKAEVNLLVPCDTSSFLPVRKLRILHL